LKYDVLDREKEAQNYLFNQLGVSMK